MRNESAAAQAQQHIRAALDRIGPRWAQDIGRHSQEVKELYAPVLLAQPREGIRVCRDLAYGDDPRQVLDVFAPRGAAGADVVVFVHGGAFVRGDKSAPEGVYDNVLLWFARQGFVGVNVEYRPAPRAAYPQGALDVAAALEWVARNIEGHGGDARRILLIGHSAGGTHVASYAMDPALPLTGCRARALVLVSARLKADVLPVNPNAHGVRAYFGEDASLYEARSPLTHAQRCPVPAMVVIAQYENPLLDLYGLAFAEALAARDGAAPRVVQCEGHNHMSVVAQFDTGAPDAQALGREILQFWRGRVAD
ncbi:alpha/beta hydrolase [Ramlibacter rhizophilus]|uniref:Alpha/beta hydrolase n=1 Tax=Ramlibacter rhizophilus TaxID=1781167 RepID=A0A4Z0C2J5_9BURK|nr:alpha/beta hydrolase [Ramlibacter rhizophilus]TFZ04690.1 alpha/beta hydrolase [Ramlibacter rhizophilus]